MTENFPLIAQHLTVTLHVVYVGQSVRKIHVVKSIISQNALGRVNV